MVSRMDVRKIAVSSAYALRDMHDDGIKASPEDRTREVSGVREPKSMF